MLTLYYKPTCAYCQYIFGEIESLGIKMQLKDVSSEPLYAQELMALGGKKQVPYLVDSDRNVELYESHDIVEYLVGHYGQQKQSSFGGLKIHKSEEVCDTCQ